MNKVLEIDSVILEFGLEKVLQDVYLKCETGKITGLLGRNGSGKSCLMRILFGELKAINKSVRINGQVILSKSPKPKNIIYLPQFEFIPKYFTLKNIFRDFNLDFSEFIIWFPAFKDYYRTTIKRLSGGERRIVEIYIILKSNAKFCLLDEPFSQVMPLHVETIKSIMQQEKMRKGILVSDHLYEHIMEISDQLYILKSGKTYLANDTHDIESLGYIYTE